MRGSSPRYSIVCVRPRPPGLTYASYRLEDGVSFVHVASMDDPDNNPLRQLAAFQAFTAGVRDRCDAPPVTTVLNEVGRYSAATATHA